MDYLTHLILQTNIDRNQPTETTATRGERCLTALKMSGQYSQHPPGMDSESKEPSVLSSDELTNLQNTVEQCPSHLQEASVTALLSPKIMEALREETELGLILSNTESTRWLPANFEESAKNRRKPDLLTAHPLRIAPSASREGSDMIKFRRDHNIAGLLFGGLDMKKDAEHYLSSLWEGKLKLGNLHQALGEMVDYVKCWGVNKCRLSIILYDMDGFVVGESIDGVIRTLYHLVPWNAPGSKKILKNYMTKHASQKVVRAQKAMADLQVRIADLTLTAGESAYLGSGSFGDVFRVQSSEDELLALKIARSDDASFTKEYYTLNRAKLEGAPVVQVQSKAQWHICAYTMKPVGRRLDKTSESCRELFRALRALHNSGWCHGDARYPNAIKTGDGKVL